MSTGYDPSAFGPDTTQSGMPGTAQGLLAVVPGQVFNVYVGQYGFTGGGWGWASGGAGGTGTYKVNKKLVNNPGAGGGGASAILTGPSPQQIVAVGGGGGGNGGESSPILVQPPGSSPDGYPNLPGGNGGDAGQPGDPGWALESAPGGTAPNDHGKVGGCGGCQGVAQGYEGSSLGYGHDGSGGGGGGGGFKGGGGGDNGYRSFSQFGMGGGGGGGGSSFIASSAIDPSVGTASSPCLMNAGGGTSDPDCYGNVTFTWPGAPQTVTIQGANSADATIGGQFSDFKVVVTDKDGVPVPNATVTFSGPSSGPGAVFASGGNSTAVVTDPRGLATLSGFRANGSAGNWNLTATASGGSSPSTRFSMINRFDSSTTTLGANPDPSYQGQPVQIYADVAAGSSTVLPTGVVVFLIDDLPAGAPVAIGAGSRATLPAAQVPALAVGTHTIRAVYPGDSGHADSQDSESQTVNPTPTSITVDSSVNPSGVGAEVELTATVIKIGGSTGTPTGTVEFHDDDLNLLGAAPLDGTGKAQFSFEPLDTVTVAASYGGDSLSGQSTGRYVQSVGPEATSTVITSSESPVIYGQKPTYTAQVRRADQGAAVEGTIGIEIDGEIACPEGDVDSQGQVTCTPTTPLEAGVHEVDAKYNPPDDSEDDQPDKPSTGSFNQVVQEAPSQTVVSIGPEPSVFGQPTTLNVGVTLPDNPGLTAPGTASILIDGIGAGNLTLTDGGASRTDTCAAPGTCPYSAGSHIIEADYTSSNPNLLSTDASVHHQVTPAPTVTTIVSSADPVKAGTPVTFEANVDSSDEAGTPDGRVAFVAKGSVIGGSVPLTDGKATSAPITTLPGGTHEVTARYLGSSNFGASDASLSQHVTAADIPDRGHPFLRFKGTRAKVGRGGALKVQMICGGDRGMVCRGLATVKNRKAVKFPGRGRKKTRVGPGKLLARKSLNIPAGDTVFQTFRLSRTGKKLFRTTKKVPSLIRLAAKSGTDPSKPYGLTILSKVKRQKGGHR